MSEYCVIHANCQGDPLVDLLRSHPEFAERYSIRKYTNFQQEIIPAGELEQCSLFVYQHLGDNWAELASKSLLGRVNPAAKVLRIPNMLFKGYWPFWTNHSNMEFGDVFLDKLLNMGLGKAEVLYVYLQTDITRKYDLAAMFEESMDIEAKKEAECIVSTTDVVRSLYSSEHLFNTINHPNRRLVLRVAQAILQELNMEALPELLVSGFENPYPEFELPIHPQVAAFHGLEFIKPECEYQVFTGRKTFAAYAEHYVDCAILGIESFSAYLHIV